MSAAMIAPALPATKRRPGRPTIRTPEIAQRICEAIASGKSLRRILARPGMPSYAAVCVWLREDREFQEQYARAREAQADSLAEEIIEIADGKGDVQRDRLRIDARIWYAGKLRPKKYGVKLDTTTVNVGVAPYVLTEERRAELIRRKRESHARGLARMSDAHVAMREITKEEIAELVANKRAANERMLKLMEQSKHPASNGHRAG